MSPKRTSENKRDNSLSAAEVWSFLQQNGLKMVRQTLQRLWVKQIQTYTGDVVEHKEKLPPHSKVFPNAQLALLYTMCTHPATKNCSAELYSALKTHLSEYCSEIVLNPLSKSKPSDLLHTFVCSWHMFDAYTKVINHVFRYLNRFYVKLHHQLPTEVLALHSFREKVLKSIGNGVIEQINNQVTQLRKGEATNEDLLVEAINVVSLVDPKHEFVYKQLELAYLQTASKYYANVGDKVIKTMSLAQFFRRVQQWYEQERRIISKFLVASSPKVFLQQFNRIMLKRHYSHIFFRRRKEFAVSFFRHSGVEWCNALFKMFQDDEDALNLIAEIYRLQLCEEGLQIMKYRDLQMQEHGKGTYPNSSHALRGMRSVDAEFVEGFLHLYEKYHKFASSGFNNHSLFSNALKEGFTTLLNKDRGNITNTELLAQFSDYILNSAYFRRSERNIEDALLSLSGLFQFMPNQDLFRDVYQKLLSSRLLATSAQSCDLETAFLSKLKLMASPRYTSKMEAMTKDISRSKTLLEMFYSKNQNITLPFNLGVKILTRGFWPSFRYLQVNVPKEFSDIKECFETFYKSKHPKHDLKWLYGLGTVHIVMHNQTKTNFLITTTLQAFVLSLFNDSTRPPSLSYDQICAELRLPHKTMAKSLLRSLSCGKWKILLKKPSLPTVREDDCFRVNEMFSCDKCVKLPTPSLEEKAQECKKQDPIWAIDASIMRIMKGKKLLRRGNLVEKVLHTMSVKRFGSIKTSVINERIDHLVENEYLEPDKSEPNLFHYIV